MSRYAAQGAGSFNDKYTAKDRHSRRVQAASYVMLAVLAVATAVVVFMALTK